MIEILRSMCVDSLVKQIKFIVLFGCCDCSTLANIHRTFCMDLYGLILHSHSVVGKCARLGNFERAC